MDDSVLLTETGGVLIAGSNLKHVIVELELLDSTDELQPMELNDVVTTMEFVIQYGD